MPPRQQRSQLCCAGAGATHVISESGGPVTVRVRIAAGGRGVFQSRDVVVVLLFFTVALRQAGRLIVVVIVAGVWCRRRGLLAVRGAAVSLRTQRCLDVRTGAPYRTVERRCARSVGPYRKADRATMRMLV